MTRLENVLSYASSKYNEELRDEFGMEMPPYYHAVGSKKPRKPVALKRAKRKWLKVTMTEFHRLDDYAYVAQLLGLRSDGQYFYGNVRFPLDNEVTRRGPEEWIKIATETISKARVYLDTFRDCSCGIIGYKRIGEDEIPIMSPCDRHPSRESSEAIN